MKCLTRISQPTNTPLLTKLRSSTGTILYLGASVTAQKAGYRQALHGMLCKLTGRDIPMQINALGGIGSLFGFANFRRFADDYRNVDLVIFEYSTGDLNLWITPKHLLPDVIDSFFAALRTLCPNVIVLHNYRSDYTEEKAATILDVYNSAAQRYHFPVINMFHEIATAVNRRPNWLTEIYRDHVHPTETGAAFIASTIISFLEELYETELQADLETPAVQTIDYLAISDLTPRETSGAITYPATGQVFHYLTLAADESLPMRISGLLMGLVLIMGPDTGHVALQLNEEQIDLSGFDRNSYYFRPHCQPVVRDLGSGAQFTVQLSARPVDFSIAKVEDARFALPRCVKLCGLVGKDLRVLD